MKRSMNEISNTMKEATEIFNDEINAIARDEIVNRLSPFHIRQNDSFGEETERDTDDEKKCVTRFKEDSNQLK